MDVGVWVSIGKAHSWAWSVQTESRAVNCWGSAGFARASFHSGKWVGSARGASAKQTRGGVMREQYDDDWSENLNLDEGGDFFVPTHEAPKVVRGPKAVPTAKQVEYLERWGVEVPQTRGEASDAIGNHMRQQTLRGQTTETTQAPRDNNLPVSRLDSEAELTSSQQNAFGRFLTVMVWVGLGGLGLSHFKYLTVNTVYVVLGLTAVGYWVVVGLGLLARAAARPLKVVIRCLPNPYALGALVSAVLYLEYGGVWLLG